VNINYVNLENANFCLKHDQQFKEISLNLFIYKTYKMHKRQKRIGENIKKCILGSFKKDSFQKWQR
jgi:hypothetical protein